jgi:hypothetical protein
MSTLPETRNFVAGAIVATCATIMSMCGLFSGGIPMLFLALLGALAGASVAGWRSSGRGLLYGAIASAPSAILLPLFGFLLAGSDTLAPIASPLMWAGPVLFLVGSARRADGSCQPLATRTGLVGAGLICSVWVARRASGRMRGRTGDGRMVR